MAKITLNKLGLKKKTDTIPLHLNLDSENPVDIELKQYLPIQEKLDLITKIVNESIDENGYWNPCRVNIYINFDIFEAYSNVTFTEKQKEEFFKTYDILASNDIFYLVNQAIGVEYKVISSSVWDVIESYYKYQNSARGIMEQLVTDYSALDLDTKEMEERISNPENLTLLKDVLTKLG